MKIEERIDVEALLKSIGSLQDLQFRQQGLEPATQQVVDAAKALFRADGAGLMLIGKGEVPRWVTATDRRAQVIEAAQERLGEGSAAPPPCLAIVQSQPTHRRSVAAAVGQGRALGPLCAGNSGSSGDDHRDHG